MAQIVLQMNERDSPYFHVNCLRKEIREWETRVRYQSASVASTSVSEGIGHLNHPLTRAITPPTSFPGFQMPTTAKGQENMCRDSIQRTLALSAGIAPDAHGVAEGTLRTWGQMAARLTPVIGVRGVEALFSRSLQVASASFPQLSQSGGGQDEADPLKKVKACLEAIDPVVGTAASFALLVTFTELLATLIGESLTERLLDPVWAPSKPAAEQETKA